MHHFWLMKTLALAKQRRGFCSPNPAVGAVVVRNNVIISEGCHYRAGLEHAEYQALRKLPYPIDDATLYISLEPCSHWGKTPPCIDEIVASGIKTVVFGYEDPNPKVKCFDTFNFLKEKNIECHFVDVPEISDFYQSYAYWHKTGKPFVTLKIAQSMNGKIARAGGHAVSLSGPELNLFTHQKRKSTDIILTTAQTIVADNPQLNVRLDNEELAKPIAVIDRQNTLLSSTQKCHCFNQIRYIYSDKKLVNEMKLQEDLTVGIDTIHDALDLGQVISHLGDLGFHDVWVEAGGKLATSLLNSNLVNRMYVYVCGQWLGQNGVDAYVSSNALTVDDYQQLTWQQMGHDMLAQFEF